MFRIRQEEEQGQDLPATLALEPLFFVLLLALGGMIVPEQIMHERVQNGNLDGCAVAVRDDGLDNSNRCGGSC